MTKDKSSRQKSSTSNSHPYEEGKGWLGWLTKKVSWFARQITDNEQPSATSSTSSSRTSTSREDEIVIDSDDEETTTRQLESAPSLKSQQLTKPIQFESSPPSEYKPRFSSSSASTSSNENNDEISVLKQQLIQLQNRLASMENSAITAAVATNEVIEPVPRKFNNATSIDILKQTALRPREVKHPHQQQNGSGSQSTPYSHSAFALYTRNSEQPDDVMQVDEDIIQMDSPKQQQQSKIKFSPPATPTFATPTARRSISQRKSTPHPNASKSSSAGTPTPRKIFTPSSQASNPTPSNGVNALELDSSQNYSETAKRILETLDQLSSPLVDVRKQRLSQTSLAVKINQTKALVSSAQKRKEISEGKRKRKEETSDDLPPRDSINGDVAVTPLKKRKTDARGYVGIISEEEQEEISPIPAVPLNGKASGGKKKRASTRTPYGKEASARQEAQQIEEEEEERKEMKQREQSLADKALLPPTHAEIKFDSFEPQPPVIKPVEKVQTAPINSYPVVGFNFEESVKKPEQVVVEDEDDGFSSPEPIEELPFSQFNAPATDSAAPAINLDIFKPVSVDLSKKSPDTEEKPKKTDLPEPISFDFTSSKKVEEEKKPASITETEKPTADSFGFFAQPATSLGSGGFSFGAPFGSEPEKEEKQEKEAEKKQEESFAFGAPSKSDATSAFGNAFSSPSSGGLDDSSAFSSISSGGFSFGAPSKSDDTSSATSGGFSFGAPSKSDETSAFANAFSADTTEKPTTSSGGFSFTSSSEEKTESKPSSGFSFGDTNFGSSSTSDSSTAGFSFSAPSKSDESTSGGFSFSAPSKSDESSAFGNAFSATSQEISWGTGNKSEDTAPFVSFSAPSTADKKESTPTEDKTNTNGGFSFGGFQTTDTKKDDEKSTDTNLIASTLFGSSTSSAFSTDKYDFSSSFTQPTSEPEKKKEAKRSEEQPTSSFTPFSFSATTDSAFSTTPATESAKSASPVPSFSFSGSTEKPSTFATNTATETASNPFGGSGTGGINFNFGSGANDAPTFVFQGTGSGPSSTSPAFGASTTSSFPGSSSPAFGASAASPTAVPSGFAFNSSIPTPTTGSAFAFGSTSPTPTFGQSSSPAFGASTPTSSSSFGFNVPSPTPFAQNPSTSFPTGGFSFSGSTQPSTAPSFGGNGFGGGMMDEDSNSNNNLFSSAGQAGSSFFTNSSGSGTPSFAQQNPFTGGAQNQGFASNAAFSSAPSTIPQNMLATADQFQQPGAQPQTKSKYKARKQKKK